MVKRASLIVRGVVQGVFYRQSAAEQAGKLGLTGFARNEEEGMVRIEAQGEEAALAGFLDWCKNGPELARVTEVESSDIPTLDSEKGFAVF